MVFARAVNDVLPGGALLLSVQLEEEVAARLAARRSRVDGAELAYDVRRDARFLDYLAYDGFFRFLVGLYRTGRHLHAGRGVVTVLEYEQRAAADDVGDDAPILAVLLQGMLPSFWVASTKRCNGARAFALT